MKINTKSWHFRAVRKVDKHPSNNLCAYFWQVVYAVVMLSLAAIFMLVVALLVVQVVVGMAAYPFLMLSDWGNTLDQRTINLFTTSGFMGWGIAVLALIAWALNKRKSSPPSLLAEYLSAKKRRICPLIEFESDGE